MAYEVIRAEFRTELHARWSVFFDHLRVPWAYEPVTFYDSQGSPRTPAFWLPEQRMWFAAELEAPVWWGRFAMAAEGSDYWGDGWGEQAGRCLPVEVPEEWQGLTLLSEGPFFPDDDPGIDTWGRPDPWDGPWRLHEAKGMLTYCDSPYQWTMCPQCWSFGAEFCGYAERLPCGCLNDGEHSKVAGGSDKRLLAAYRAAQLERWHDDISHATVLWPTVREALVQQPGAGAAAENCVGECQSVAEQMRQELCPPDPGESEELETLCSACPGFVCGQCGEQPTPAANAPCRTCEPVVLLTENQVRQRINWKVEKLAAATGMQGRRVNGIVNDSIGEKRRSGVSLAKLGTALTNVERWLDDPSSMPTGLPAPSPDELGELHGAELRKLLTTYVGPLAGALRDPIPFVQRQLNDWMGASSRAEATDEQLRDAIIQARAWIEDPDSYRSYTHPEPVEPGGLAAPMRTKNAVADSSCDLCAAPVVAGELIGRMPNPRNPFKPMAWLCAHCLYDRRAKPRLTDVLLRVFHHTLSGSNSTLLNTTEAAVLLAALLALPHTMGEEHLQEAITELRQGIDAPEPVMQLSYHPAQAAVAALDTADLQETVAGDAAVLAAVAQHLAEWQHNPQNIDQTSYRNRALWRQAVLESTPTPTVLSQRGGPFWV
ncbi:hypothetical protein OG590_38940 (plasmid) [Streptomyces goshikiensis]|uniref:hypothetical protein n=1 Tax=Streptomyces goshikiensis TaxID=1942 RepID=UPI002F9130A1|nr:hypothetical protein OG590_38940 [Streptomyces goshikiensis]